MSMGAEETELVRGQERGTSQTHPLRWDKQTGQPVPDWSYESKKKFGITIRVYKLCLCDWFARCAYNLPISCCLISLYLKLQIIP